MRLRTRSTSDLMLIRMGADAYRICSATEADLCHRAARSKRSEAEEGSVVTPRVLISLIGTKHTNRSLLALIIHTQNIKASSILTHKISFE